MEVGIFEARNRFSELVEAAERGEEVVELADRIAERNGRIFTHEEMIEARDFGRR